MEGLTKVYLVLGTPQSGRREIVFDLIEGSSEFQEISNIVLLNSKEPYSPATERLRTLLNTKVLQWEFANNCLHIPFFEVLPQDRLFFILSGKEDLIDQIEGFKGWLDSHPQFFLARSLSVIDCGLVKNNEALLPWFEALIHFSDYVLLNRREAVTDKWVNEFIKSFEKQLYPCIFERVKKNQVENPGKVLEPEARRISHLFDDLEAIDTLEIDENNLPEEPFDLKTQVDPYLERGEDGQRVIHLPRISG